MIILALLFGIALPTVTGFLLVRLLEGKTPVLFMVERIAVSFLLGLLCLLSLSFALNVTLSVPFSRIGFLGEWFALTAVFFGFCFFWKIPVMQTRVQMPVFPRAKNWVYGGLFILMLWTILKVGTGGAILGLTPPYFDDVLSNWNLRGKVYFVTQTYQLHLPTEEPNAAPSGINGYPPLVPLTKTWLSAVNGNWSEPLVNIIHLAWLLSACAITWSALRRFVSSEWALLAVYGLVSLPLYFIHGVSAYADVCLSAYIASSVGLTVVGLTKRDASGAALLRIGSALAGMLAFVKNEGLAIYTPTFIVVIGLCVLLQWKRKETSMRAILMNVVLPFAISFVLTSIPFIIFKVIHHLPFGNAHSASGVSLSWQPGVLNAVLINTFFEGNWLLLFPLLLLLLVWQWKKVIRLPCAPIAAFVGILYFGQLFLFLFTYLSTEAVMQTGYARGLIQMMPLFVMLTILLLASILDPERTRLK